MYSFFRSQPLQLGWPMSSVSLLGKRFSTAFVVVLADAASNQVSIAQNNGGAVTRGGTADEIGDVRIPVKRMRDVRFGPIGCPVAIMGDRSGT